MPEDNDLNNGDPQELSLDEVVEVEVDSLSDEQKTFLEENKGNLSDEQLEKYGLEKEPEEEPELEPEIRREKKVKTEESDEEPDEIEPDDERIISKVIDRKLKEAGLGSTQDQIEVDVYIRDNPEYSKYRKTMLKFMSDPSYNNIPAHYIAAIVSGKDQQKIGAEKERAVAKKVAETKDTGGSVRKPKGGGTDWGKATPEEIEAKKSEIYDRRV